MVKFTGLGLMMIVKDEAEVIERCLLSVRDHIDWWVIADTGSTDRTVSIIRDTMAGIPGNVYTQPWVNFQHNRNEVLAIARSWSDGCGDYALWLDADEQFVVGPEGFSLGDQDADGFYIPVHYDDLRYNRLAIVSLSTPWRWEYPIHEVLVCDPPTELGFLETAHVLVSHDGARSKDPETYVKDANLCREYLTQHPDDPRMQFYYAQSLKDAGLPKQAREAYRRRADNPVGWDQERWYAMYQHACLRPPAHSMASLLDAYDFMPSRAEPLVEAARRARIETRHNLALILARNACYIPMPGPEALFVDTAAYLWQRWDEYALACYNTGDKRHAIEAGRRALAGNPLDHQLIANLAFYENMEEE